MSQHSNILVTTSGFRNQLEKVCFDTSAGDRIFGAKNQLSQPRNISHRIRIDKSDWLVDINNPSNTTSKITMSVTSAAANIIFKGKAFISAKNSSEPIKNRITMVDNKSRPLQWPIINSSSCTGSHTDRCLNKGLGGNSAMVYELGECGQTRK